jgi:hypothetical protein
MLRAEIESSTPPEVEASDNPSSHTQTGAPLTNALAIIDTAEALPGPVADLAIARDFARNEKAAATRRAYDADFDAFVTLVQLAPGRGHSRHA